MNTHHRVNTQDNPTLATKNADFVLKHWYCGDQAGVSDRPTNSPALESKAKAVLNALSSIGIHPNSTPTEVRALRKLCGNPFDYQEVNGVASEPLRIPVASGELAARQYRPQGLADNAACLVFIIGGGFVLGDLDYHERLLMRIAKSANISVIAVTHHKAPEQRFPGPVDDIFTAYEWIYQNAKSLNIDTGRIALGGDSSGGNLATVVCVLRKEQSLPQPLMQLLIYPSTIGNNSSPSRKNFSKDVYLTSHAIEWFHNHYIDPKQAQDYRFNVLGNANIEAIAPAFILTAGFDPLRDEGWNYAQALKRAGVGVAHCCFTDVFHGFMNFGLLPQAKTAVEECGAVLKAVLSSDI